MKALFLTLIALSLHGCGGSDGTEAGNATIGALRWDSFPVPIYADPQITQDVGANDDLHDAFQFWEQKAGKPLFDYRGTWTGGTPYTGSVIDPTDILANVILLQNTWPFGSNVVGKTHIHAANNRFQRSLILLDGGTNFCTGDCAAPPSTLSRRKLLTHELGHFLGLDHVSNENNIMYPEITIGGKLDDLQVDMNSLKQLTN